MLARSLPKVDLPTPSTSTLPPALPGLVSSLRPIKRLANQLADEANLLSRFTYKNKNQHKGNGWWRRVVQVDRVIHRLVGELGDLLDQFGVDVDSKQEIGLLGEHALVPGLIRLPRATALVEKTLSILLGASSILEQLVDSRAFLAFALVVVALVSRLHAITTVLSEELAKTATVLVRLVKANALLPTLMIAYKRLPRDLRRFIPLAQPPKLANLASAATSAGSTRQSSPAPIPPPGSAGDELGAPISRDQLARQKPAAARNRDAPSLPDPTPPPLPCDTPTSAATTARMASTGLTENRIAPTARQPTRARAAVAEAEAEEEDVGPRLAPARAAAGPTLTEWSVLPPAPAPVPPPPHDKLSKHKKKKRVDPGSDGGGTGVPVPPTKKKKRKAKAGDEIDDIFG